jgi:hypothetical protein
MAEGSRHTAGAAGLVNVHPVLLGCLLDVAVVVFVV